MATTNNKRFVRVSSIGTLFDAGNLKAFLEGGSWDFVQTAKDGGVTKDSIIFLNQVENAGEGMYPEIFYPGARIIIAQGVMYDATTIDKQLLKGWNSSLNVVDTSINADDNALAAFGKLQGQINALKQGISDVSVIVAENDAPYATTSKDENGIIIIDLSVGTLADASNGATGLAKIEDIYQVLTEDELVWAAALNALNVSINIVNASVINHETRITNLEASIGSLGPDLTQRVINLESSVYNISTWVNETKTWITNTDSSITNINSSITNIKTDITNINTSIENVSTRVKALEDASYVHTVRTNGDQWVKASFDTSVGDPTLTVGMADNVMVNSGNITGTMSDSSILTAKAVQDMINNTVTGAVDFLGVFGTDGQVIQDVLDAVAADNKGKTAEYGDFFKFAVDIKTESTDTNPTYHAGDILVYNSNAHSETDRKKINNWTLVHGEPDTNTWREIKVNGTTFLTNTVNSSVLDISAGANISIDTIASNGKVVINVVDTSTAPWHDAANDWALL